MSLSIPSTGPELTRRECEVLNLIAKGRTNKEIAKMLDITTGTVEWHVHTILARLGAQSSTEAVVQAIRLGYIDADDTQ